MILYLLLLQSVFSLNLPEYNPESEYSIESWIIFLDSCATIERKVDGNPNKKVKINVFKDTINNKKNSDIQIKCYNTITNILENDKGAQEFLLGLEDIYYYEYFEIIIDSYLKHLNGEDPRIKETMDSVLESQRDHWRRMDSLFKANIDADSIEGIYIPKNLEETIDQMYILLDEEFLTAFANKEESLALAEEHLGLGMYLRNRWRLWSISRLSNYFIEHGILCGDGISWAILTYWHRYLNGKEINIDEFLLKESKRIKKNE